jgi:hypothetical protein
VARLKPKDLKTRVGPPHLLSGQRVQAFGFLPSFPLRPLRPSPRWKEVYTPGEGKSKGRGEAVSLPRGALRCEALKSVVGTTNPSPLRVSSAKQAEAYSVDNVA